MFRWMRKYGRFDLNCLKWEIYFFLTFGVYGILLVIDEFLAIC